MPRRNIACTASEFAEAEWTTAFKLDPTGKNEKLIPVRIEDCQPPWLLGSIIYIDLVKLDEAAARERIAGRSEGPQKAIDRASVSHSG